MEPTNHKALYHKLMDCVDKVMSGDMTPSQGKAISELAARMNKARDLEHDRVRVCIEAENHAKQDGSHFKIREVEGRNFD